MKFVIPLVIIIQLLFLLNVDNSNSQTIQSSVYAIKLTNGRDTELTLKVKLIPDSCIFFFNTTKSDGKGDALMSDTLYFKNITKGNVKAVLQKIRFDTTLMNFVTNDFTTQYNAKTKIPNKISYDVIITNAIDKTYSFDMDSSEKTQYLIYQKRPQQKIDDINDKKKLLDGFNAVRFFDDITGDVADYLSVELNAEAVKFESVQALGRKVGDISVKKRLFHLYDGESQGAISTYKTEKVSEDTEGFQVLSVKMEFSEGGIKNAIVNAIIKGEIKQFKNYHRIPLSTLDDIWSFNSGNRDYNILYSESSENRYAKLSDIIFYNPHLLLNDVYIPADTTIEITMDPKHPEQEVALITLYRRNFTDDFDIRIYTDATGFVKNSVNGLVQTDMRFNFMLNSIEANLNNSKDGIKWIGGAALLGCIADAFIKDNIVLSRHTFSSTVETGLGMFAKGAAISAVPLFIGLVTPTIPLGQIQPYFSINKLEDKGGLVPALIKDTSSNSYHNEMKSIDLLRYSKYDIGVDLSVLESRIPFSNFTLKTKMNFGLLVTPIDSMITSKANPQSKTSIDYLSWYLMPEFIFRPISSPHIDFIITYGMRAIMPLSNKLSDTSSAFSLLSRGSFVHKFQFDFNLFPDVNNRDSWYFTRAIVDLNGIDHIFRLQIGVSTTLQKILPAPPPPPPAKTTATDAQKK
jgi:hypothetical protein